MSKRMDVARAYEKALFAGKMGCCAAGLASPTPAPSLRTPWLESTAATKLAAPHISGGGSWRRVRVGRGT